MGLVYVRVMVDLGSDLGDFKYLKWVWKRNEISGSDFEMGGL